MGLHEELFEVVRERGAALIVTCGARTDNWYVSVSWVDEGGELVEVAARRDLLEDALRLVRDSAHRRSRAPA